MSLPCTSKCDANRINQYRLLVFFFWPLEFSSGLKVAPLAGSISRRLRSAFCLLQRPRLIAVPAPAVGGELSREHVCDPRFIIATDQLSGAGARWLKQGTGIGGRPERRPERRPEGGIGQVSQVRVIMSICADLAERRSIPKAQLHTHTHTHRHQLSLFSCVPPTSLPLY